MAGGDPKIAEQQSILAEYVYVYFLCLPSSSWLLILAPNGMIADK